MTTTETDLQTAYDALYAEVKAIHDASEQVCMNLYHRLAEAEIALTDYQIANGTFKWVL
jgi:hypothetical protein